MKRWLSVSNLRLGVEVLLVLALLLTTFAAHPNEPGGIVSSAGGSGCSVLVPVQRPQSHRAVYEPGAHLLHIDNTGGRRAGVDRHFLVCGADLTQFGAGVAFHEPAADFGNHGQAGLAGSQPDRYFGNQLRLWIGGLPAYLRDGDAMNRHTLSARHWRAILDGLLILLLMLALTARDNRAQAQARDQAPASQAVGFENATLPGKLPAEVAPAAPEALPAPAVLDNNTLAAMIAAENAALTQQQFWLDLPLVHR